MSLLSCCKKVNRKKPLDANFLATELHRCLGITDLTLLGVSGMLGAGLYVLTGAVAKTTSGPAVVLSYVAAAFAAFLSALCYAEFGARIPTTGSSYIFTYVTMGELWGFLMGWNMVLEHGVGSASVAKVWSGYLDSVMGYPIKTYLSTHIPMGDVGALGEFPDLVAAAVVLVLCAFVASGVKSSTRFNMIFAILNIAVVLFIVVTGFCLADVKNWTQVKGGFFPFGASGVIAGASRCFFAFAGFDVIASSCEEARNPKRDIPISLAVSLVVVTISYVGVSSVLTLMVPWYDIVPRSAIPDAYAQHDGWQWAQVIVTVGSLCTMTTSMFSGLFVLPRILYAISKDGLLCPILSNINEKTQVPLASVVCTALLCSVMALIFDLETLVQFMSIGTLTAYSFVAACVILLRYDAVGYNSLASTPSRDKRGIEEGSSTPTASTASSVHSMASGLVEDSIHDSSETPKKLPLAAAETTTLMRDSIHKKQPALEADCSSDVGDLGMFEHSAGKLKPIYRGTWLEKHLSILDPGNVIITSLTLGLVFSVSGMLVLSERWDELLTATWWVVLLLVTSLCGTSVCLFVISAHQQHVECGSDKSFKVPFVPFLPYLCICTNLFFMMKLQAMTWIRLVIWISVGFAIYFLYGFHKSQLNPDRDQPHWISRICDKVTLIFKPAKCCGSSKDDQEELISNDSTSTN